MAGAAIRTLIAIKRRMFWETSRRRSPSMRYSPCRCVILETSSSESSSAFFRINLRLSTIDGGRAAGRCRKYTQSAYSTRFLPGISTPKSLAAYLLLQPWRCLWRGLVQITRTTPLRRITLQRSQIRLTEHVLSWPITVHSCSKNHFTHRHVKGGHPHLTGHPRAEADASSARPPAPKRHQLMTIGQNCPKSPLLLSPNQPGVQKNQFFFTSSQISAFRSSTATVCSHVPKAGGPASTPSNHPA
jgi:hypothetical protein